MANQRHKDKIKVQTYLHRSDAALLKKAAQLHGYDNLPQFLQAIARQQLLVPRAAPNTSTDDAATRGNASAPAAEESSPPSTEPPAATALPGTQEKRKT
jgi:hypothetical protein